jgi:hypothetical protein
LTRLDAVKVSAELILVKVTVLYLLGHLPFPLACLLGVLKLETVLIHRESHCLQKPLLVIMFRTSREEAESIP